MDWHARAVCARVSVSVRLLYRKCNVLPESLIRFVSGESSGRPVVSRYETPSGIAVSDVGATEVRKYFSAFVTRPVYWFRQIVPERTWKFETAERCTGNTKTPRGRRIDGGWHRRQSVSTRCTRWFGCDRRDDGLS